MIKLDQLTKVYGNRIAVWKVSFEVKKGEILGFLGPNGAGKTTTMRMLTGFIPPSSGSAVVGGLDVRDHPLEVKQKIGYLCEMPPVYREMEVRSYLRFVADIKRVPKERVKPLMERALELTGLEDVSRRVIGNLSKGYRQRVGLAQAILPEPEVLILDEPTVGLDPKQLSEIRQRIRALGGEQTIVLSTHILPEVTATCSRVVIINEGQIIAQDSIEGLMQGQRVESLTLSVSQVTDHLVDQITSIEGIHEAFKLEDGRLRVRLDGSEAAKDRLVRTILNANSTLLEMTKERASLEDVFLSLVQEEDTAA